MIDLSEITDKVARAYWEKLPGRPSYDTLSPHEKVGLKQSLLPIINQTATLVEAEVRQQISTEIEVKRVQAREAAQQGFMAYDDGRADAFGEALDVVDGGL